MIGKLPHKIKLSSKDAYSVVIVPRFDNKKDIGECDPNAKQIRLVLGETSDREVVSTLSHEALHQINFFYDLGLTENQILGLEKALIKLFKLNPTFTNLYFEKLIGRKLK